MFWGMFSYREYRLKTQTARGRFEKTLDDPVLESRVDSIASRFECVACGVCRNMPLETCTCSFAVDSRHLIRREVVAHVSDEDIINVVNEQFGGFEGELKTQSDSTVQQLNPK